MNRALIHTGILGALLLVLATVFWPVLSGRATFVPTDILHQLTLPLGNGVTRIDVQNHYTMDVLTGFYPGYEFFSRCLRQKQLPIWNPLLTGGHPIFADSVIAFANPFNIVFFFLGMPAAYHVRVILHFLAAGLAMYLLLSHWKLSPLPRLLGTIAYALNSHFLYCYWFGGFQTFAWMPVVLMFFDRALSGSAFVNVVAAGLLAGVAMLSGNLQSSAYIPVTLGLYALGTGITNRQRRYGVRAAALAVSVTALGALVAAVQFIPSLELLARDAGGRLASKSWSLAGLVDGLKALPFLSTFAVPSLWGSTETFDLLKAAHASANSFQGYIGIASFVLLLMAVATWQHPQVKALVVVAGGVLGLLLFVPPLRQYFYDRFLVAYVFAAAPLAAFGLEQYLNEDAVLPARVRRTLYALGVFLLLVLAGVWAVQLAFGWQADRLLALSHRLVAGRAADSAFGNETAWTQSRLIGFWRHWRVTNPAIALPLLIGGLSLWFALKPQPPHRRRWCAVALIVLTAFELSVMARQVIPMVDTRRYPLYPPLKLLATVPTNDLYLARLQSPGRRVLPDNILMPYNIRSFSGYESVGAFSSWDVLARNGKLRDPAALAANSVSHLLARADDPLCQSLPVAARDGDVCVLALPNPAPRVRLNGEARIIAETPTKIVIAATNQTPGELVLADTFYPGWRATVDGQPTPVTRANEAHRAVFLPAGAHQVVFTYRPLSLLLGAAISATAIVAGLAIIVLGKRRS